MFKQQNAKSKYFIQFHLGEDKWRQPNDITLRQKLQMTEFMSISGEIL